MMVTIVNVEERPVWRVEQLKSVHKQSKQVKSYEHENIQQSIKQNLNVMKLLKRCKYCHQ